MRTTPDLDDGFDQPTPPEDALAALDALLASPSCRLLMPEGRYRTLLEQAVRDAAASGSIVFHAQIVAVCLEHGARTILTDACGRHAVAWRLDSLVAARIQGGPSAGEPRRPYAGPASAYSSTSPQAQTRWRSP